jgi:hypothetical protein
VGYEAERVCRSVQEERPSCSTSGGQSSGGGELWGRAWVWDWGRARVLAEREVDFLVWEAQSAKEVQDRQLRKKSVFVLEGFGGGRGEEALRRGFPGGLTVFRLFLGRHLSEISSG